MRLFGSGVRLGDLDLSGIDDTGVQWCVENVDGWLGSPATTYKTEQNPAGHGGLPTSPQYLASREVTVTGWCAHPDPAVLSAALDRLNAASFGLVRVTVTESGRDRWMDAYRVDDLAVSTPVGTYATFSIPFEAADPRKYGADVTVSTNLPSSVGGLTWPLTWPVQWNAETVTGILRVDNPGNIPSGVLLRFDGPVQAPRVRHVASGAEITFSTALTLSAGQFLTVDTATRQVLEQGQASRNGWVVERGFFMLDPGPNDLIFSAAAYDPAALLTATVTPAWL